MTITPKQYQKAGALLSLAAATAFTASYYTKTPNLNGLNGVCDSPTRGYVNKNPGNIIITSIPWQGKVPNNKNTDGKFEQFTSFEAGIRAMMLNLLTYYNRDKLTTIEKIIYKWSETDQETYTKQVAADLKTSRSTNLQLNTNDNNLAKLATSMAMVEICPQWAQKIGAQPFVNAVNIVRGRMSLSQIAVATGGSLLAIASIGTAAYLYAKNRKNQA